jgi:NDP-sugar pyrophosphorylase family protein
MGIYVLRRDALRPFIVPGEYLDMPALMQSMQQAGREVLCHRQECIWLDIGRPEDFAEAQAMVERDPLAFLAGTI